MDLYQQKLEAGDNFTKSKSWSHPGTSNSQNNCIGLNCNVNPPLEDGVNGMSFEKTMSSVLQFLAQDEQYMDHLQYLQDTKTHEKVFLNNSDATQSADLAIQKQLPMPCDQNPDQSNRNHGEDERRGKKKWREREKEEEKEEEVEEKQEEEQEERLVSKPLMDTLWATFKLNACPTIGDRLSLAFEFNMTEKQIDQWFCKKRKKYNKEMKKQKYKKRLKRC